MNTYQSVAVLVLRLAGVAGMGVGVFTCAYWLVVFPVIAGENPLLGVAGTLLGLRPVLLMSAFYLAGGAAVYALSNPVARFVGRGL